ncbi:MAG: type II secretion system F family protein [Deltaproteobacteria bacterium]|nr:type II secretion system F family protein [Deltaproteobacteria bacterium]
MSTLTSPPFIAASLFFTSLLLAMVGIYLVIRARKNRLRLIQKIKAATIQGGSDSAGVNQHQSLPEGFVARLLARLGKPLQPKKAQEFRSKNLAFLRAGIRSSTALPIFWGAKCVLALALAAVFLSLETLLLANITGAGSLVLSLLVALGGYFIPDLWLRLRTAERMRRIQNGLPDALDLMVVCVEAGMSLDAATHRVAEEIRLQHKELSEELVLTNLEIRAGKLRRDALRNLALRTNLEDVSALASLLIQTDHLGTSVAQALRVYSESFRTQRMQKAEEIAAKLPVKLILPLGLCILPAIFIVVVGPAVIRLIRALSAFGR